MESTAIALCKCKNEFQDKVYGVGKRVHNFAPKSNKGGKGYRCTICLAIKSPSEVGQTE